MTRVKFVHTADLHLDTPFKGLSSWNGQLACRLKNATLKSFQNTVDLCLREEVDFLLVAGDIFDSEDQSLKAQLQFIRELKRLDEQNIATYIICGNHDPRDSWVDALQLPPNTYMFGASEAESFTHLKEGKPAVDIHGISYKEREVQKDLTPYYQLKKEPSPLSVALLHGTATTPGPHENYAPFRVEDIAGKNFDYWALGHIHKRAILRQRDPAVVYPGNPQGRDFGETGARGCYLVEMERDNPPKMQFVPTQMIRFEELEVDLSDTQNLSDLPDAIDEALFNLTDYQPNTSYILRIVFTGRTSLHTNLNKEGDIDELWEHLNQDQLSKSLFRWIDTIQVRTQPNMDLEKIKKGSDFQAEIVKTIEAYENNPQNLEELIRQAEENFKDKRAGRKLNELSRDEQKILLEKAKWQLLEELLKDKE